MGNRSYLRIIKGSKKDRTSNFEQYEIENKIFENTIRLLHNKCTIHEINNEEGIKLLKERNKKFNKSDVLFTLKENNEIIWLEKGNDSAGLKHICDRHGKDFKNLFNIKKDEISNFIKNTLINGKLVDYYMDQKNGRNRIHRVYKCGYKKVLVICIGDNGFIVSAFPDEFKKGE